MLRKMIAGVAIALVAVPAAAAVLCQKRSGALFVRETCKKRETPVEPTAIGIVGPKGDPGDAGAPGQARAFACSEVSLNGAQVEPCANRPSKNVVAIVGNVVNEGVTCFVLDPSIDAPSAIVMTSFHDPGFGPSVNVIVHAVGTDGQVGCPANSIVVMTGRYRQADVGTGMDLDPIRLSVNIAVM
jgi:hypothetical protein